MAASKVLALQLGLLDAIAINLYSEFIMADRMSIEEFAEHCNSDIILGYGLKEGQVAPQTYDQLLAFMGDRIGLEDFTVEALTYWLMSNKSDPESCSPEVDTGHVSAVILIGELRNKDEYVACLPVDGGLALPPTGIVRALVDAQD